MTDPIEFIKNDMKFIHYPHPKGQEGRYRTRRRGLRKLSFTTKKGKR